MQPKQFFFNVNHLYWQQMGLSEILRVSDNVFPLLYRGFCRFTCEIVNQSNVKGKSWWMNTSRPLQSSESECGINYWGVGRLSEVVCSSSTAAQALPPHPVSSTHDVMMFLCAAHRHPFNGCARSGVIWESERPRRPSVICSPLALRFANEGVPSSSSDVH